MSSTVHINPLGPLKWMVPDKFSLKFLINFLGILYKTSKTVVNQKALDSNKGQGGKQPSAKIIFMLKGS